MGFFSGGTMRLRLSFCFLLAVAALVLAPGTVSAQVGLGDVMATQAIRSDLESRNTGRAADASDSNGDADPDAGAADDAAGNDAADTAEPAKPSSWDKWDDEHSIKRSKSAHVSWLKLVGVVVALLIWVRTGDWINRDAQIYRINFFVWNSVLLGCGVVAGALLFVLPAFASLPALFLAALGPMIAYAIKHNATVEPHQKVFTGGWFRHQIAVLAGKVGIKLSGEEEADYLKGAAVDLIARGSDDPTVNQANLLTARRSPGYVLVKQLIADMVASRSEQAMLDYRQDTVAVRRLIDGVWHNGEATERDSGDVMLAVMKQLANLKPAERRAKQAGQIGAEYEGGKYNVQITSQGVKTGERVMVGLKNIAEASLKTYSELGLRDKIRDQWAAVLAGESGLAVISAMPGGGLTTLTDVSLMETDRLMRDFFAIEDVHRPEREIENVVVKTFDSKQGESAATIMPKLVRLYPNVYVCRDFGDPESAKIMLEQVKDEKLLITTVHAKEATEALLRLLQKKVPHRDFAENVTAVINMRLIRLLCDDCKVGFEPAPALLQKLGIPQGKVEMLYAPPKPEEEKKPCPTCGGLGYKGRTGLFELLNVNDKVREVLLKQPKMEYLRKAARTAGMRNHQEEGILLVAKGATSLQELQRVLKE